MMDKKKILDNGILEQYLLGELNKAEQIEVENILNTDAELKAYYDTLEADFETMALENAIQPPSSAKTHLLQSVSKSKAPNKSKFYLNIAASIAGFLFLSSIWMYSQLNSVKKELQVVEDENIRLNRNIENLNDYFAETNKWYVAINDPDVQKYVLTGNTLLPEAKVISYVNHKDKSLVINTKRLPKLEADRDYQMWADVKGEMINMGVIKKEQDMLAMRYIENAESLNITIEPAGGNDQPTVSQLVTNIQLR